MGTPTWTPIANTVLSATQATVTFSSIPQTYKDLVLIAQIACTGTSFPRFYVNGVNTTVHGLVNMIGNAGGANSVPTNLSTGQPGVDLSYSSTFGTNQWWISEIHFMDYTSTAKFQSGIMRGGAPDDRTGVQAWKTTNAAAISSISMFSNNQPWAIGSTFALYGIAG